MLILVALPRAQAQSFSVLHFFTNGGDGGSPSAGVTLDAAGNIYGTASTGGNGNEGTVFQIQRSGDGWTLNTLHTFEPSNGDGKQPLGRPVFGPMALFTGRRMAVEPAAMADAARFMI